ncbi:MAG: glycosyltransferase family 2 protein, partial [Alphaproteobacteria bacterium]|nr:glycosyltransferase family 2 protein [Alphaproteobacteria bacterium]
MRDTIETRPRTPAPARATAARPGLRPDISLVIPMHNEEEMIDILYARLTELMAGFGVSYEVICVNDGSRDRTLDMLLARNEADPRWKVIDFSRNFGKEVELTAGLRYASGRTVVPLDADLQDPPELIGQMLEKWREGYDVIYAVRRTRRADTLFKRTTASAFYWIMERVMGFKLPRNAADFRLMDRKVVDAMNQLDERNRFMKGLFAWIGFRQTHLEFDRPERAAGKTKYKYWQMWNYSLDGITSFSTLPLRISSYIGATVASLAICYGAYLLLRVLIFGRDVPGYASLMVSILALGGLQLIILGIIGEYLGRLYLESKKRPLFIVDRAVGFDPPEAAPAAEPAPARSAADPALRA